MLKVSDRERTVFVRVGWMKHYNGPQFDDEKPVGGGKWNKTNVGGEAWSFRPRADGHLYSYFHANRGNGVDEVRINLERIDPAVNSDRVDHVLVVFFALDPVNGGQAIVGWYDDATVMRYALPLKKAWVTDKNEKTYFLTASTAQCTLVPEAHRDFWVVEGGAKKGRPGTTNIFYPNSAKGEPLSGRKFAWIDEAIEYVRSYQGPNLLNAETQREIVDENLAAAAEIESSKGGQGFARDAAERKAIDERAMKLAAKYLKYNGYTSVVDTHVGSPFDFTCKEKNGKALRIEVKGSRAPELTTIFVTHGEIKSAREHSTALLLVEGIKVERDTRGAVSASGGKAIMKAWTPTDEAMTAMAYRYQL